MTLRPRTILLLSALAFAPGSRALAETARCEAAQLVLDNGAVRTVASWTGPAGRLALTTDSLAPAGGAGNFLARGAPSFRLLADGLAIDGSGPWSAVRCEPARDERQGEGATLVLTASGAAARPVDVRVTYLLYPGLPVVRKRLAVRNAGTADLRLEGVEVERLHTALDVTHTWTMASYGRQKRVGPTPATGTTRW